MTRTIPDIDAQLEDDQLEDLPAEESLHVSRPAAAARDLYPKWSGRSSKVRVSYGRSILRDHQLVSGGSPTSGPTECIDCLRSGRHTTEHSFHAKATKLPRAQWFRKKTKNFPTGILVKWLGPEGETMTSHEADGLIAGTRAEAQHNEQQRLVDLVRGIVPEDRCRLCQTPIGFDDDAGQYGPQCPSCGAPNGLAGLGALQYEDYLEIFADALPHEKALDIERNQLSELKQQNDKLAATLSAAMQTAIEQGDKRNAALIEKLIEALSQKNGSK